MSTTRPTWYTAWHDADRAFWADWTATSRDAFCAATDAAVIYADSRDRYEFAQVIADYKEDILAGLNQGVPPDILARDTQRARRGCLSALDRLTRLPTLEAEDPGASPAKGRPSVAKSVGSLDSRAVATLLDHPEWTKKQIAAHLACHAKSLAPRRCPKLSQAMASLKSRIDPGRRRLRGTKNADGSLEAWEET